jgi:hypothetical protein
MERSKTGGVEISQCGARMCRIRGDLGQNICKSIYYKGIYCLFQHTNSQGWDRVGGPQVSLGQIRRKRSSSTVNSDKTLSGDVLELLWAISSCLERYLWRIVVGSLDDVYQVGGGQTASYFTQSICVYQRDGWKSVCGFGSLAYTSLMSAHERLLYLDRRNSLQH